MEKVTLPTFNEVQVNELKDHKSKEKRKKIFNIIWIIFGGLFSSIYVGIIGITYCLTIVGIPFGIQYFKLMKLIFAPANKRVTINFKSHILLNILWLIFGGFWIWLAYTIIISLISFLLIATPFISIMYNEISNISILLFAPFGAKITSNSDFVDDNAKHCAYTASLIRRKPELFNNNDNLSEQAKKDLDMIKNYNYETALNTKRIKPILPICNFICYLFLMCATIMIIRSNNNLGNILIHTLFSWFFITFLIFMPREFALMNKRITNRIFEYHYGLIITELKQNNNFYLYFCNINNRSKEFKNVKSKLINSLLEIYNNYTTEVDVYINEYNK